MRILWHRVAHREASPPCAMRHVVSKNTNVFPFRAAVDGQRLHCRLVHRVWQFGSHCLWSSDAPLSPTGGGFSNVCVLVMMSPPLCKTDIHRTNERKRTTHASLCVRGSLSRHRATLTTQERERDVQETADEAGLTVPLPVQKNSCQERASLHPLCCT